MISTAGEVGGEFTMTVQLIQDRERRDDPSTDMKILVVKLASEIVPGDELLMNEEAVLCVFTEVSI